MKICKKCGLGRPKGDNCVCGYRDFDEIASQLNSYQQPIGLSLTPETCHFKKPSKCILTGVYCRLEPLDTIKHVERLFQSFSLNQARQQWTYLPASVPTSYSAFKAYVEAMTAAEDFYYYAIINAEDEAVGIFALMRLDQQHGVVEIGMVTFSEKMRQTVVSTEAHYLLARYVFEELGMRRYEWKADALNEPSKKAANRLGFSYEGLFNQLSTGHQRNRDTVWFAMTDSTWARNAPQFVQWLAADNFDAQGRQLTKLIFD